ncbi:E3 SUMO-protein ligase PIAS4-like [Haemaphysalis longicornis]
MVIVLFKTETRPSSRNILSARVKVNGAEYLGLPLTMVNIGPICQGATNKITISFCAPPNPVTVFVKEVAKFSEEELLRSLRANSRYVHKKELTKALVKANFARVDDDAIVDCLEVSLICPLSRKKMVTPSRGFACLHVQCFDAFSYLAVNEATLGSSWACPLCRREVFVEDLRIDLLTLDILRKTERHCSTVKFLVDASWEELSSADGDVIVL